MIRRHTCGTLAVAVLLGLTSSAWSQQPGRLTQQSFRGFVQPWESIEVAVAESGRVDRVAVRPGADIKQGDLIARLDDAVLQANLHAAKQRASAGGEEQAARARLNHAAARRDDIADLLNDSHASQTELDQAELAVRQAEAELLTAQERRDIAEADVKRIQAEINRREIRSPIDGVVIDVKRKPGEYAGATDPVIATVAVLKTLRLRVNVPTNVATRLRGGTEIEIELPELRTTAVGHIDFVSPITDSQSGTVRVDVRLDNSQHKLRGGLLGVVTLTSERSSDEASHAVSNLPWIFTQPTLRVTEDLR